MISFLYENDSIWQGYAKKICGDTETAKDIVQEMYIKLKDKKKLNKAYVYMTILTLFYDLKRKPVSIYLDDLSFIEDFEEQKDFEKLEYIKKEFQKIPFQARECLIENQDLSYRKLSEKYKINYQYIRRLAEKAKEILLENQTLKDLYYD